MPNIKFLVLYLFVFAPLGLLGLGLAFGWGITAFITPFLGDGLYVLLIIVMLIMLSFIYLILSIPQILLEISKLLYWIYIGKKVDLTLTPLRTVLWCSTLLGLINLLTPIGWYWYLIVSLVGGFTAWTKVKHLRTIGR